MFSPRRSLPRPDRDAASINDAFQRVSAPTSATASLSTPPASPSLMSAKRWGSHPVDVEERVARTCASGHAAWSTVDKLCNPHLNHDRFKLISWVKLDAFCNRYLLIPSPHDAPGRPMEGHLQK